MERRPLTAVGAVLAIGTLLIAVGISGDSAGEVPFTEFRRIPNDKPVISSGSEGWPTFMSDPCVIKDEEGYHAFFTNLYFKKNRRYWISFDPQNQNEFEMNDFRGTVAYAFSNDQGLTWMLRKTPCRPGRDAVLSQFSRPFKPSTPEVMGYSIRTDTLRYTRWIEWPGRKMLVEELYDYTSGPGAVRKGAFLVERKNMVDNPAYIETRNRLRKQMDRMLNRRTTMRGQ